jgi:hypothetical protein
VADLPGGWNDGFGEETDGWTRPTLTTCLGGRNTIADRVMVIGGNVLADDHDDKVSSMVVSYRSQQDVEDDNALLTSAKAQDCFRQMFEEETEGAQAGRSRTRAGDPDGGGGRPRGAERRRRDGVGLLHRHAREP